MKIATVVAATCLSVVGLAAGPRAQAIIKQYELNIPQQSLDTALRDFAQQTGLQVALFSDTIDATVIVGPVSGTQSAEDALKSLLAPHGLNFKMVGAGTIAVLNPSQRLRLAQAPDAGPGSETEKVKLEEVVVTAQKRMENLRDVPMIISVVSGESLDKASVVGVNDVLRQMPGVTVVGNFRGTGSQVAIRGVTSSGEIYAGANPIAYYLDSIPFGLVKSGVTPDAAPYDLERLEVLKGPQGTLYGASAENGVVRILTHDANLDELQFKARTGLSDTEGSGQLNSRVDAAVNVPLVPGKLAVRAVVGYQELGGWIDNYAEQDANQTRIQNYRLKVNAQPTERVSLGFSVWSSRTYEGALSTSDENNFFRGYLENHIRTNYDAFGLKVEYEADRFTISSATSYLDYKNTGRFETTPFAIAANLASFFQNYLQTITPASVLAEEVNLASRNTDAWRWSAGAIYRDAKETLLNGIPLNGPVAAPTQAVNRSESYAVYGELGRTFFDDRLELTAGLRYFHDTFNLDVDFPVSPSYEDEYNATTPRVVLTWHAAERVNVFASYAQGFRSGFAQEFPVANAGIPPVKPDRLNNFEIGTKADFLERRLSLEAAVFYIKWDDVQQNGFIRVNDQGYISPINGESASGPGVDLGLTLRPVEGLDLNASVGWNDLTHDADVYINNFLQISKGQRLNSSSEYTGSASAAYTMPMGGSGYKGTVGVSASYNSKMYLTEISTTAPGTLTAGDAMLLARANFTLVSPRGWSAMLYGDNLTNENGAPPGFLNIEDYRARIRPRTVGVQFDFSF